MGECFIYDAVRTPRGRGKKNGALHEVTALELATQVLKAIRERNRLDTHWQQKLQRACYDVELAERRYRAVDPTNRLVAGTLETQWEQSLSADRELQNEYDRFQQTSPTALTDMDRERIHALSSDIPTLWNTTATTHADRKEMVRCLVDRVIVHVRCDSEYVDATIHWKGGYTSQHEFARPVSTYARQRDFEAVMNRIAELRSGGHTAVGIAAALNAEGYRPPKRIGEFTVPVVYQLLKRRGLLGLERACDKLLGAGEWWLVDLARTLGMSHNKLRDWARRGWVHSRRTLIQKNWILWADVDELARLKSLLSKSQRGINAFETSLTTPKVRGAKPPN